MGPKAVRWSSGSLLDSGQPRTSDVRLNSSRLLSLVLYQQPVARVCWRLPELKTSLLSRLLPSLNACSRHYMVKGKVRKHEDKTR